MKKILLITVVSFVIVGILSFIALNAMHWATQELEKNQRPKHAPSQTQKN